MNLADAKRLFPPVLRAGFGRYRSGRIVFRLLPANAPKAKPHLKLIRLGNSV